MPIVRVDFWEGVGKDKVKTMIRGITNIMVDLGSFCQELWKFPSSPFSSIRPLLPPARALSAFGGCHL